MQQNARSCNKAAQSIGNNNSVLVTQLTLNVNTIDVMQVMVFVYRLTIYYFRNGK